MTMGRPPMLQACEAARTFLGLSCGASRVPRSGQGLPTCCSAAHTLYKISQTPDIGCRCVVHVGVGGHCAGKPSTAQHDALRVVARHGDRGVRAPL